MHPALKCQKYVNLNLCLGLKNNVMLWKYSHDFESGKCYLSFCKKMLSICMLKWVFTVFLCMCNTYGYGYVSLYIENHSNIYHHYRTYQEILICWICLPLSQPIFYIKKCRRDEIISLTKRNISKNHYKCYDVRTNKNLTSLSTLKQHVQSDQNLSQNFTNKNQIQLLNEYVYLEW